MTELSLPSGGRAEVVEFDDGQISLRSTTPAPPGKPISAGSPHGRLSIKVRGCRREGDAFRIDGRCVNLTKAQARALASGVHRDAEAASDPEPA